MSTSAESRRQKIRKAEDEMLARFGDRRDLMLTVIEVFLDTYPETLESVRLSARRHDAAGLEDAAHKLKGAVSNLIKGRAFQLARELEQIGREARWGEVEETLAAFEMEMLELDDTLRAVSEK